MSEVLGDADPHDGPFHEEYDDHRDDPDLDDFGEPYPVAALWSTVLSPAALAIAALVVAAMSLLGFLSSYLITNALTVTRPQSNQLLGLRVDAWVQLGLGVVAIALALLAHRGAARDANPEAQRTPRAIAGAALVVALLSIAQSIAALVIVAGAHIPSQNFNG